MNDVYIVKGQDPYSATSKLLKMMDFRMHEGKVLIKPNLVTVRHPGNSSITTDPGALRAVLERLEGCEVCIAEASSGMDTMKAFRMSGYDKLSEEFGAELFDLNKDKVVMKDVPKPVGFRRVPIASRMLDAGFLIDVAKLKMHSHATVSLCMKNLFGAVVPRSNRIIAHAKVSRIVNDILQLIKPGLCIVDGVIGNQMDEVNDNPVRSGIVVGGADFLSVDMTACRCMGVEPSSVEQFAIAEKLFGKRDIRVRGENLEDVAMKFKRGKMATTVLRYALESARGAFYKSIGRWE